MNKARGRTGGSASLLRKTSAIVIVSMMVMCCLVITDPEETEAIGPTSGTCGTDLKWSLDTTTLELTITGTGAMTNYTIDSTRWGGNTVKSVSLPSELTTIGDFAFYSTDITSVTIPNKVTSIGTAAFAYCSDLTSVSIGSTVTSIGAAAFWSCTDLTAVTIPASVTTVGDTAFGYSGLTSINIPDNVTSLGSGAFEFCSGLTTATIGNGVVSVGSESFYNCTNLTSVSIGSGVTSINGNAFGYCQKLTSITVNDSNTAYTTEDGVLFNKAKGVLVQYPAGKANSSYAIPATVTTINDGAFTGSVKLTDVTLPNGLLVIGEDAFAYCTNLSKVEIPDSVTTVESFAFLDCYSMTGAKIGKGATTIGVDVFFNCYKLTSIDVDTANTNYSSENGVLFNKAKTTLIQYPVGKTADGYTIPATVTTITEGAFSGNSKLKTIVIPDTVTSLGTFAFSNCTGLTSLTIGSGITVIDSSTFKGCCNLKDLTIGANVTTIGMEAFADCVNLTKITFPDKVKTLQTAAFSRCLKLTEVSIGSGMTSLGSAFSECPNLSSFTVNGTNTTYTAVDGVLFNKEKTTLILYPAGKADEKYSIPDTVTTVNAGAFEICRNLKTIVIPSSVTTVNNQSFNCVNLESFSVSSSNNNCCAIDGVLFSKSKTMLIDYPAGKTDESYTVPETVTTISGRAFAHSTNLHSVELSESTTSIGEMAFDESGIRKIYIPSNVISIGALAFARCFEMEEILVSGSNNHYSSVDGVLYDNNMTAFIHCPAKYSGKVMIPQQTNYEVAQYGLAGCGSITGFDIEEGSLFFDDDGALVYNNYGETILIGFSSDIDRTKYDLQSDIHRMVPYSYSGRDKMEEINTDPSNILFSSTDGCLYDKSGRTLIKCPTGKTSFEFGSGVSTTGMGAFDGDNLSSVTFSSDSKVFVTMESFVNCTSLKKIVIEDGADVSFGVNSIVFTDGKEHTIYVVAPDGFELDKACCSGNVKIVYGEPPSDSVMTWVLIGAGVIGAIALIGVAIFIIRRFSTNKGGN